MRRHILLGLLILVIILVLSSFTSAVQFSTNPEDYYTDIGIGFNLTDGINSSDFGLDGVAAVNGQSYETRGWVLGGVGTNEYSNDQAALGVLSIKQASTSANIDVTDNTTFTGSIGIQLYDPGGNRNSLMVVRDVGLSNVMDFGLTIGANWEYNPGDSCDENTIARVNGWHNMTLNYTSSATASLFIDGVLCHKFTGLNGLGHIFLNEGGGFDTYWDEFWVANDDRPLAEAEVVTATAAPVIVDPTPPDNTVNNTNVTLNVTHPTTNNDVTYFLYFNDSSTLTEEHLVLNNVARTGDEYKSFTTIVSVDGAYFYKWKVRNTSSGVFSTNTTQRTWTLDTTSPTITLNPTNAFNNSNISSQIQYLDFMFFNLTFTDETGLFGALINVTKDGVSFFNFTNVSLGNILVYNFTRNITTSSWPDGVYDIELIVADGHTSNSINDYEVSQFISRITFDTEEGNEIDIIGSGAIYTEYTKRKDRYEFAFNYLTSETTRKFTVKCDNELSYIANSNHIGHFVCWDMGKKNGNWIDFNGVSNDYTVKKVNDKEYDITFTNIPSSKKVSVKSIGGLNRVTENYQWFKGSTNSIFNSIATSGSQQTFRLNITLDFDLVKNITARFTYNETLRTVIRTESVTSILFNSTFSVPDVNQTLNISWFVNITQRNDTNYVFSVNSSQQLVSPQINLSIFDEENQSLISQDLTIFFSGPSSVQTNTSSGMLSIGGLLLGEYLIQAEGTNYPKRGIFFTVTNASADVNLYLVNDIAGNDFIDYIIQDDGRNRLENVRMTFQKNINNSFVTVAQTETDFAGQSRIFQDQQNEYRIVVFLEGFATQTIDLLPLLTTYTITLATLPEQIFDTTYEGIRYTISPAARVLNASGLFRDISLTIFDSTSSLEFFGLQIINHSYECIPANCITNITGSPAGGTATVKINLSEEGSFDTQYFFKRNGFDLQFINGQISSVRFLIGDRLTDNFETIGRNLGTDTMRSIFAAVLITVLVVLTSQMGVVGSGFLVVISLGTIFFMLLGFIPKMVAMITLFFGLGLYFVLGREQ